MHHRPLRLLSSLSVVLVSGACAGEGSIGNERCIGENTRCEGPARSAGFLSTTGLVEVSSNASREATLVWSKTVPCSGACAWGPGQVLSDGEMGMWFVSGTSTDGVYYEHVSEQGERTHEDTVRPPSSDATYLQWSSATPVGEGFALGGSWAPISISGLSRLSSVRPDFYHNEIVHVDAAGAHHTPMGESRLSYVADVIVPSTSFSAIPYQDAFLTFSLSTERKIVRKVDALGSVSWQQVALPYWAELAFGAVTLDHGFALGASMRSPGLASGVLWFDADGNLSTQVTLPSGWIQQTRISFAAQKGDRVALAGGLSAIDDQEMPEARTTDLYLIELAKDGSLRGMRVVAQGPIPLSAYSLAADPAGNLYVSTVAGTKDAPRGLICMLPTQGDPACYGMPSGVFPKSITSPAPGVVYAVSRAEVVRLQLGE